MQASKRKPIGILGGTFDPIHIGHLRMALEIYEAYKLDNVHLIPCYEPVHRRAPIATPQTRLEMVKVAIQNEPTLIADDIEIMRKGPSYTIDTLIALQERHPQTPLALIIGIDAFLEFAHWHRYQEILQYAHIIVANRPAYQLPSTGLIADLLRDHLQEDKTIIHTRSAGCIFLHEISLLEISASAIRKQIAMTQNPRYLLPDTVYEYIQSHHIYRETTSLT